MISYLRGKVIHKTEDAIILDVQGVGYKVFLAEKTLSSLTIGEGVELYCYLYVREETLELYGVPSLATLQLFEVLNNISGIGPKAALSLSSLGTIDEFRKAIREKDQKFFGGMKGIGKKKIQKIILELTGKLEDVETNDGSSSQEALQALTLLGFSLSEARAALSQIPKDLHTTEEKVREALKIIRR